MDKSEELHLRMQVSKLSRIAVINLETVMRLANAIEKIPNAPESVRDDLKNASKTIDEQIEVLRELYGMGEKNESI